ncbi:MAG: carbamate kinase [Acidobacteria bacterium]|nr:carbamate kinase [Acidobacteriota bacterium]NIM62790.1 carbamate kinase [Acidobacteriota bacterium]NIO60946.1 carbamate kinase [Acidobacteriota bacterium]NIQ31416.1 carbamate kinase [Acidobacteriota bacterium]NIQ87415.1 carbamate kinase [Acidobacteriota bacterium]
MGVQDSKPIALVAMGGHAFIQSGEAGTIEHHEANARSIARVLMTLVERDYRLVITHGNGPQIGHLLLQHEMSKAESPEMPLDVLVAMTEGSLGYILQQALLNELRAREIRRFVVTVVTQVLVDENDPAFRSPTKPIGPFLTREDAEGRRDRLGWAIREDAGGRGWRRLVASPKPTRVIQADMIREAAQAGHIVVAGGGGGVPIKTGKDDAYQGVEAVVDKDLTSAVLAASVGAELLIMLTSVPNVYTNFGEPDQAALGAVTLAEIEQLHADATFPPGSMGPKIDAVIDFLHKGGRRALITDAETLPLAIQGGGGTHFVGKL